MRLTNSHNVHNTQGNRGIVRPRLYTLEEASEHLGESIGTLIQLIKEYSITPPFPRSGGSKNLYRISDFQTALNERNGEHIKIDRDIPIPPRYTKTSYTKTSKWRAALESLEPGDSIALTTHEYGQLYNVANREFPNMKLMSRKTEDGGRRVWRIA